MDAERPPLHFFTFCNFIGRISPAHLIPALQNLVASLRGHGNRFVLDVYSNFGGWLPELGDEVRIRPYEAVTPPYATVIAHPDDLWKNMCFNRFWIAKRICREQGVNPIWIDLDTIVCANVEYLADVDNFFVMQGSEDQRPFPLLRRGGEPSVPHDVYIQGNIWKLNEELIAQLEETLEKLGEEGKQLDYDTQGLFNYYYHVVLDDARRKGINILGESLRPDTVNGLCVWNRRGAAALHPVSLSILPFLHRVRRKGRSVRSSEYPEHDIHFLSFTFRPYTKAMDNPQIREIVCPAS